MSKILLMEFVFYITLQPYLHQWLTHALGNPVRFPRRSNENAIIKRFIQKNDGVTPELFRPGVTPIIIPDSKAKPVVQFNYMGPRGKKAVIEMIEDLFRRNLWNEIHSFELTCGINAAIDAWCELHGIDDRYTETIRQKFYRMRKSYNERGVYLGKFSKIKGDNIPDIEQLRTF